MKMRKIVIGMATALSTLSMAHAQEVVLKVAHFLPPVTPMHSQVIVPWCERIAAQSAGRMKCQIYPAMQLGGTPPQLLNQVRDGVADIVWTLPGYTPGRFPLSEVFELPFISTTHEATARALWDFVEKHGAREFEGIKPIATWTNGPNVLNLRERKVDSLENLKGLKVRAPSRLGNKMLATLGATAVGMPVPQMTEALSKGVIDAGLVAWEVVPATKTHELTRFHLESGGGRAMTTATMIYVMNQKRYDSLPPDLKKIIDDNSGRETSAWVAQEHLKADTVGRNAALARGNTVYQLSAEESARWEATAQPVIAEWISETSAKGADGQKLYEEARALVDQYSK
jgi:TRAP-type transport system periplasmic protein